MQNIYTKNSILIFLPANNFSEEEFLPVKRLFLKNGKELFITSDTFTVCSSEDGLKVGADTNFYNVNEKNFAAFVLIGGKGSRRYWENESLHRIARKFHDSGKVVGAICSTPVILARSGILDNTSATCWKEDKNELMKAGINYQERSVIAENKIVTADSPQSAVQFTETVLNLIK
jgi:protease I